MAIFKNDNDEVFIFEQKWLNFTSKYIEDSKEIRFNVSTNWIHDFIIQTVHLTTILLPTLVDTRFIYDKVSSNKVKKKFHKSLNKMSENDYRQLIKLVIFDYFNQDRIEIRDIVNKEFPNNELENFIYDFYLCSEADKQIFKKFILKGDTFYPTFHLLEKLHFGEYAKDQKTVELCEYLKDELYNQFDHTFKKFYQNKDSISEA